jgi:hypothetical protein
MRFTISTIVAGVTGALAGSLLMASAVTGQDTSREPVMLDQVVGQEARLAGACKEGQAVAGSLGLSGLACDCTHYLTADRPERNRWEFRSEPTILGVIRGGPADGKLEEGDAIVAIDGQLITTREGGRRFAQVRPDAPVGLTVRRDGRERRVTITAGSRCLSVEPAPVADVAVGVEPELPAAGVGVAAEVAPVADAPPVAGVAVGLPPAPPDVWSSPQGWLGLSFSCTRCGIHVADTGAEGETMSVWEFSTPPVVESVEQDGPAREAGVRAGDAITHIDDVDITSQEGGRRFGRLEPGQEVRLRVERSGRSREVRLRADERPRRDSSRGAAVWSADRADQEDRADRRAPVVPPPDRWEGLANGRRAGTSSEAARFTGLVGDVLIQVTGGPITVEESDTEVVIRSRDITVRISKTDDTKPERP